MGDIKFTDDTVMIEGWTTLTYPDLKIDYEPRRTSPGGYRRTLVHNHQDGITINYSEDYPGGVTISGQVKTPQELHVGNLKGGHLRCSHHDLHLDNESRRSSTDGARRALVHNFQDGLTINWASDYPGGVTIQGEVKIPGSMTIGGINVGTTLTELLEKVDELQTRVNELEKGTP